MKTIYAIFLPVFILLMCSCSPEFDDERFEKEGERYLEEYSEQTWCAPLESLVQSRMLQHRIDSIKEHFAPEVFNIDFMRNNYGEPKSHDILLVEYGIYEEVNQWSSTNGKIGELSKIPACIVEDYLWEIEPSRSLMAFYLRKGNQLIPLHALIFPEHFHENNYWIEPY